VKNFKKDLNDAVKMAKALTLMVGKLQKQFVEMEKKHPKMPAKKATAKKSVTKKLTSRWTGATDAILAIVNRSKKGVDTTTLMKKTGFDRGKVTGIISRQRTQGKIQNVKEGVYVKA
jgi:hypothetical protein